MSLVAWIADFYGYFGYSHSLDSTLTGTQPMPAKVNWMKKITVLALSGIFFALCISAEAQQPNKIARIGFLGNSTAALEANLIRPFHEGLRDFGKSVSPC
jgi:hypothetical protein